MHGSISGVVDHVVEDDREALDCCANLMAHRAGRPSLRHYDRATPAAPQGDERRPAFCPARLPQGSYDDARNLLSALVDERRFTEFKRDYGKTLLCAQRALTAGAWALSPTKEPWSKVPSKAPNLEASSIRTARTKRPGSS